MAKNSSETFEKTFKELSDLVEKMEHGDLSLEQSLDCFEKGVKLSKTCQQLLEKAEQKVETLLNNKLNNNDE